MATVEIAVAHAGTSHINRREGRERNAMQRPFAAVAAVTLLLTACSADSSASTGHPATEPDHGATVVIDAASFAPRETVVEMGTTVTWVWSGGVAHDVSGEGFKSQVQFEGEFRHTFDEVGVEPYRCTLHPGMEATIKVVRP